MSIFTYLNTTDLFNPCKTRVHCGVNWQVWVSSLEEVECLNNFPTHTVS